MIEGGVLERDLERSELQVECQCRELEVEIDTTGKELG